MLSATRTPGAAMNAPLRGPGVLVCAGAAVLTSVPPESEASEEN